MLGDLQKCCPLKPQPMHPVSKLDEFKAGLAIDAAIADSPKQRKSVRAAGNGVTCMVCAATFASKGNLNRHHRSAHLGQRVFCNYPGCTQSFSQAADSRRHMRRVHASLDKP